MDLAHVYRAVVAQGPIFWSGAAAIAAGCTLMTAAVALQIRRRRSGRSLALRRAATPAPVEPDPASAAGPTPPDPRAAVNADRTVPSSPDALLTLRARLARAADRLEQVAAAEDGAARRESSLKADPATVEYVYKAHA
jgi:hypothetical protein